MISSLEGIRWFGGGKRGQSMSELAVFGSIMLLVLSFLLRQAMSYNNRQQLTMEVFRAGLQKALNGTDTNTSVIYKDFPMAEPQDEYGAASRQVVSYSDDGIVWTNETSKGDGRINYTFVSGVDNTAQSRIYTTWGEVGKPISSVNVTYPFDTGARQIAIPWMRAWSDVSYPEGALLVLVKPDSVTQPSGCASVYCPHDVIEQADVDSDGTIEQITKASGSAPVTITTVDPNAGQIDLSKADQGIQATKVTYTRYDAMNITDNGNSVWANSTMDDTTKTEYTIGLNGGISETVNITSRERPVIRTSGEKH
jgi:hypothetical protein